MDDDREDQYDDSKEYKEWVHARVLNINTPYVTITAQLTFMARICQITKVGSVVGGRYSNRTRATQFNPSGNIRRYPNLQKKRIYVPELKKTVVLTISARALRTIQKNGAFKTLKTAGLI